MRSRPFRSGRFRPRNVKSLVLATATVCVMSACSAHPGSAAEVGSDSISDGQLDDVATALCSAQSGSAQSAPQQDLASRAARQGALDVLINSSLSRQYAASLGLQPDQGKVSAALAANKATIDSLPVDERQAFRDTLKDYAEGQLMLIEVGRNELAKAGTRNVTDEQALAEGIRSRDKWASENADVSVDPRYGTYDKGALKPGSGSLSVPVSSQAVAGNKAAPSTSWISSLPASQKCS